MIAATESTSSPHLAISGLGDSEIHLQEPVSRAFISRKAAELRNQPAWHTPTVPLEPANQVTFSRVLATEQIEKSGPRVPPVPRPWQQEGSFLALHLWEGYVTNVEREGFGARLLDLVSGDREDGFFPFATISDDDRALVTSGSVFYWSIGVSRDRTKRVATTSTIRFRRLPGLSDQELHKARKQGRAMAELLGFYKDTNGSSGIVRD